MPLQEAVEQCAGPQTPRLAVARLHLQGAHGLLQGQGGREGAIWPAVEASGLAPVQRNRALAVSFPRTSCCKHGKFRKGTARTCKPEAILHDPHGWASSAAQGCTTVGLAGVAIYEMLQTSLSHQHITVAAGKGPSAINGIQQ